MFEDLLNTRLNKLQDSLLESISINFKNSISNAKVSFFCRDWSKKNDTWIKVDIELYNLLVFNLQQHMNISHQVISNGVSITKIDHKIILELGDLANAPTKMDDLKFSNLFMIAENYKIIVLE